MNNVIIDREHTQLARSHLATYIQGASECMDSQHWFALKGNCRESLLRWMAVATIDFAATLFVANFVAVDSRGQVKIKRDEWKRFLDSFYLNESGAQSVAETTVMKIDVRFLMERSHRPEKPSRADVFFVRIGPYPQGESGDPCEQINADLSPPDTTMRYRSVQRRFTLAMSDLFEKYRDLPVVAAVAAWVEWKEVADYDAGE